MNMLPTLLLPFNLAKALMNSAIAMYLYKPLLAALREARLLEGTTKNMFTFNRNTKIILAAGSVAIVLSTIIFVILITTATSAQSTATLARNQAYVLRYTGTTITGGGTIAYADIDNTDNIKAGDKIIDISGAIYAIASVDTVNQTVTVGASSVINLFCDAENLIPATNDAYDLGSASKQWLNTYSKGYYYNGVAWGLDKANVWTANNQFAKINTIETNTVEWHNSHYRGINLISDGHFADVAALLTAIRAQDWSDIYIGDYVELTFTYEGASRTVKFYVGEIDKFYKVGNASLETHHLVMVTGDLGINQVMNDSNTTAGGYVGSKAHTVTLPALYAILNPLFNNAILTHREHLSNTVLSAQTVSLSLNDGNGAVTYSCNNFPVYSSGDPNTPGCVTAGSWYDCNLVLMSEIEMFGSNRFSSSGIDDIMCPEGQIAAFKYNRNLQTLNRTINTWLRNVNSASRFCRCNSYGYSLRRDATYPYIRLRPRFLIG